jgi:DNA-binding NtrC family response regulator
MSAARLLIVDDEAALLSLLKRYLERLDYRVEICTDSQQALALFESDPEAFDLVISDLTLPGLNGEELLARMKKRNPRLRGLIASGYPYEPTTPGVSFLQKPFVPEMLVTAVKQALKKKPAS